MPGHKLMWNKTSVLEAVPHAALFPASLQTPIVSHIKITAGCRRRGKKCPRVYQMANSFWQFAIIFQVRITSASLQKDAILTQKYPDLIFLPQNHWRLQP